MTIKRVVHSASVHLGRWPTVLATAATVGAAASLQDAVLAAPADRSQAYAAVVSEGPSLPQGRACHAGGMVGDRVVVAGGSAWSVDRTTKTWFDDTLVFDPAGGTWSAGPKLPHRLAEMMFGGDGNALYLAGGKDGRTTYANAFRIASRNGTLTIEELPPLPAPLSGGAGAVLNDTFYVAGGYDLSGAEVDSLWALDLKQPDAGWRSRAKMPSPARGYFGFVACSGDLYALGGCIVETEAHPVRQVFKDVHRYDPQRDEWSQDQDLPTAGQGWVADAVDEHHILLTGRGDANIYDEVWLVDLRDSSVRGLGSLMTPSFGAPLVRMGETRWWFIGGEPDANKSRTPRVSVIELK